MTPGQRHSDKKKDKMTLRKYLILYRLRGQTTLYFSLASVAISKELTKIFFWIAI